MRVIFPLLFPWLSRGPKAPWTRFLQCMFSWLASQPSESSGVALVEICSNNNAAACPAHVNMSPHCFVSCLELLAGPRQSTLAGLPFCQRMFAASRCLCGLVPLSRVSTLQSNERRLAWDRRRVVAELSGLISIRPKWLSVCTGRCGVPGCPSRRCPGLLQLIGADFLPTLHLSPNLQTNTDLLDLAAKLIVLG